MDIKEYEEGIIETMIDDREKFDKGSKELVQHDKNLVDMFDAYHSMLKLEADVKTETRKMEQEKELKTSEITQKSEEVKKKTAAEWGKTIVTGVATIAGVGLALLSRKDEREGFLVDDKIPFFDKLKPKL